MSDTEIARLREHYGWYLPIPTRWMDNDIYGHVNNVNYYSYFDTVANAFMIEQCGLDPHNGEHAGYIVHSECNYKQGITFPEKLEGGLRVNRLGNSSVQWGIGIFKVGETLASAYGTFTHVLVDRATEKSVSIPEHMRGPMQAIAKDRFSSAIESGSPEPS